MQIHKNKLAYAMTALLLVLGVVLIVIAPRRREIGRFPSDEAAEKAAFSELGRMVQQYPHALSLAVRWYGPYRSSPTIMTYNRLRNTLNWAATKINSDGQRSDWVYNCENGSAPITFQNGHPSGYCHPGMVQLGDG